MPQTLTVTDDDILDDDRASGTRSGDAPRADDLLRSLNLRPMTSHEAAVAEKLPPHYGERARRDQRVQRSTGGTGLDALGLTPMPSHEFDRPMRQGNESTPLTMAEEAAFQQWAQDNGLTDVDHPDSHYDYRGFWKSTNGAPHPPGSEQHFPDTFKQHGHPSFSVESQYSRGPQDGGRWLDDTLIPPPMASHGTGGPETVIVGEDDLAPDNADAEGWLASLGLAAANMNGPSDPELADAAAEGTKNITRGVGKGAAHSGYNVARLLSMPAPGIETLGEAPQWMGPANEGEALGYALEQGGEFMLPAKGITAAADAAAKYGTVAKVAAKVLGEAAGAGTVSAVHGGNPLEAAAVAAAFPFADLGLTAAGNAAGRVAPKLVRSAIKPTVTAMKQQAGASVSGINAQADRLVKFILDKGITSAGKAQKIIDDAETEIASLLTDAKGVATDAPQRAQRYLQALEESASRQGLPADDVATIRGKMKELLQSSPLSRDAKQIVLEESPHGLVDQYGNPVLVPVEKTTRELRDDVDPLEAMGIARSSSKWGNKKQWGEQKGAATEASKAVERAARDSVKRSVPGATAPLQREGQAIKARDVLDRQAFREANRDTLGLPAHALAAGGHNVLALASNWLRSNGTRTGVWAKRLSDAVNSGDAKAAREILVKLGVATGAESLEPLPSH